MTLLLANTILLFLPLLLYTQLVLLFDDQVLAVWSMLAWLIIVVYLM